MSQQRLPMRKVRDVLRLKAVGLEKRKIAASLGISATAVGGCLRRAREAGVAWPLAEERPTRRWRGVSIRHRSRLPKLRHGVHCLTGRQSIASSSDQA